MNMKIVRSAILALAAMATSAHADVFLRPGESIFLGGQRVTCDAGGGGPIGQYQRNFRCEPVEPQYTSLDSILRVTTVYYDGRREAQSLFTLHFRSDCDALASQLAQRCGGSGQCAVQFCEADEGRYTSLATTMYNVTFDWYNRASVSAVDRFSYMQDCRNAL